MTIQSAGVFVQLLRDSRLVDPVKLDELSRELSATSDAELDAPTLAAGLVQLGWLTPEQADQLLAGFDQSAVPVATVVWGEPSEIPVAVAAEAAFPVAVA